MKAKTTPAELRRAQPLSRPPLERMLRIHQAIQAGDYPNATRLSVDLEVSTKTIHRDVDFMRDRLELPIEYDGARFGYYYTQEVSSFPTQRATYGWSGWGVVAGVLALVIMDLVGARVERPLATLLTAIAMLGATALAVGTRWPAWLGLALAAVTVAACLEAYRTIRNPPRRTAGGNGFARGGCDLA